MIAVVIPARNEAQRIVACLAAVSRAQVQLGAPVRVVVIADRCQDDTEVLAAAAGAEVVLSHAGRVGAARRAGVRHLLDDRHGPTPSWLACTDADSQVSSDWLVVQAEHLRAGTDLLLGGVRLNTYDMPVTARSRLGAQPHLADGHGFVYGANLGIRTATYLAAGEFPDVAEH